MRAVIQRVNAASVAVDGKLVSSVGKGLLVLLGISREDTEAEVKKLAAKIAGLRIFCDDRGKMFYSVKDIGGQILLISNFTLYGNARHGYRPEFIRSAGAAAAKPLYDMMLEELGKSVPTKGGVFGGDMKVCADNDGPVTIIIDTDELK